MPEISITVLAHVLGRIVSASTQHFVVAPTIPVVTTGPSYIF
jgi:hypothetical protein